MLTPDYLLHVSEGAEEIAAQMHTDMIKRVVSRILARESEGKEYILTASDKWRLQSLIEAGYLRDDLEQEIAQATGKQAYEIKEAFEDAGIKSLAYDGKIYEAAGIATEPLEKSPYLIRLMQRNYESTMGLWKNYTQTTADAAQVQFIQEMDDIYNKVMFGGIGYTEAYTEAIDNLAKNGLFITYPSGHTDTIETATLRCVRTGVSQASAQITEARMDEYGVELVIVSSHMGARPEHQEWQGRVYKRSGRKSRKYPDFVTSTGYGTGEGLCGWNCRHSFSPYFEGQGNPFETYDDEENVKLYEETQDQRRMERGIRRTRREAEVLSDAAQNAPDSETADKLKELLSATKDRLKRQTNAYMDFCDQHSLRPLPERLKIAKAGRVNRTEQIKPETITVKPVQEVKPLTFAEKMNAIRDRVKAAGLATDEDLHEAGKLVSDEVKARQEDAERRKQPLREERDRLKAELKTVEDGMKAQMDEYYAQIDDILRELGVDPDDALARMMADDPRIDELYGKISHLRNNTNIDEIKRKIWDIDKKLRTDPMQNAKTLKDILSQFRKMGGDVASAITVRGKMGDTAREALGYYPEKWIDFALKRGGIEVNQRKVSRGYSIGNFIALSGYSDEDVFETAIHELGHYFERTISTGDDYVRWSKQDDSFISGVERAFYNRRTAGEDLKWLGKGYKRNERSRFDKFLHSYMGKDYGGYDFELVSMGFQYAYLQPEYLAKDPDMEQWIYGILSLF